MVAYDFTRANDKIDHRLLRARLADLHEHVGVELPTRPIKGQRGAAWDKD